MARPRKEIDLKGQVKKKLDELLEKRKEIDEELKGLQEYLKAVGGMKSGRGGRRKKGEPA